MSLFLKQLQFHLVANASFGSKWSKANFLDRKFVLANKILIFLHILLS